MHGSMVEVWVFLQGEEGCKGCVIGVGRLVMGRVKWRVGMVTCIGVGVGKKKWVPIVHLKLEKL